MTDAAQAAYGFQYSLQHLPWGATLSLLVTLSLYLRGWRALRLSRPEQVPAWRAGCFAGGIVAVWIALASPLDALSGVLLTAHMIQHLLLMSVAPPLLVLGAPMVPLLRGLPRFVVKEGLGPLFSLHVVRSIEQLLASRVFAWLVLNVTFIGWHVPAAYGLALRSPGWHELEHICFLLTSVLFWWHIIAPWPTVYKASRWLLLPFLLSADLVNTALSASLSFSGKVFYQAYAEAPRVFDIGVMDDQVAAGALMWVIGSMSFLGAAMLTTVALLSRGGERRRKQEAARARLHELHRPAPMRRKQTGRARIDLLRFRPVAALLKARYGRQALQALALLLAAAVIVDAFIGPRTGSMNLAGIVPWTFARALFVLGLVLFGNLFCMSCPFTLPREASKWVSRRLGVRQFAWPRVLRNKWLPIGLVLVFFWAFEVFDFWNRPIRTAALLLGYFGVTFAVDTLFRDASFCKYVCPLGQFNFVSSLLSPVGVGPRSQATCASCVTRDCIAGHAAPTQQRGCELHLFQPTKQGNMDCTLCMDCVKACPHDNIGLFVQAPARELVQISLGDPQRSAVGRYRDRMDLGVLAGVIAAAAFSSAAVMTEPFAGLTAGWVQPAAAFVLPALLIGVLGLASPRNAAGQRDLPKWLLALLPVGLGMWTAHLLFHVLTAGASLAPGLLEFGRDLARLGLHLRSAAPNWTGAAALVAPGSILPVQLCLLDLGLLGSLYIGWRLTVRPRWQQRLLVLLPWASVTVGLYAVGIWIFLQPMQMRGMAGM